MATVYPDCNSTVAHLAGVRRAVFAKAEQGAAKASAILKAHRETGNSSISVTRGKVDSFINLDDPGGNALAIEFGRVGTMGRGTSQGVNALGGAF